MSAFDSYRKYDPFKAAQKVSEHRGKLQKLLQLGSQAVEYHTGQEADEETGILMPKLSPSKAPGIGGAIDAWAKTTGGGGKSTPGQVNTKDLNPQFKSALDRMIADSGGKMSVYSGFRDINHQQTLWNNALKKYGSPEKARKFVAPPGKSNHGRGIAADLKFADEATKRWAHANARKYGLYFPMSHEPWHIEPVGSR